MQCGGREPAAISLVDYEEVNVCHYYGSNPGCLYAVTSAERRLKVQIKDACSACINTGRRLVLSEIAPPVGNQITLEMQNAAPRPLQQANGGLALQTRQLLAKLHVNSPYKAGCTDSRHIEAREEEASDPGQKSQPSG
jgi:hypothetical protein